MPIPDDYAYSEAQYDEQAHEMGGAPASPGMAPYPLYGLPTLGQETEVAVPFYKKPVFCYAIGGAAGLGVGYLVFGWLMPRMKKPKKNRRTTRNPKALAAGDGES